MATALSETDILNMSDEDFLKTNPDPSFSASSTSESTENQDQETQVETPEGETTTEQTSSNQDDETQAAQESNSETDASGSEEDKSEETAEQKAARERDEKGRFKPAEAKEPKADGTKEADPKSAETQATTTTAAAPAVVDYKSAYEQIMAPFKANGRTVELKDPKEAVQLMQMGANYTRKMQEMAGHRKVLTMLQNNGLLDEGKLSYLIDLDKKNPDAIKKLVKDAGLDPMDIDVNATPAYTPGNHKVSDEEVAFHSTLTDMQSTPERLETLKLINDGWDDASKQALWKNPDLMTLMHDHRENGVYDRISNEIARRQTLGQIPAGTPFLHAYKAVGDELYTRPTTTAPTTVAQPVATRVQAAKPKVTNNDRAAAVSPSRSRPANEKPVVNYLNMSDDEFSKKFEGRV